MKKYIQPIVEIEYSLPVDVIMASREQTFGNGTSEYGNDAWVNEGYARPTETITGDMGTLDSYSNSSLWDE